MEPHTPLERVCHSSTLQNGPLHRHETSTSRVVHQDDARQLLVLAEYATTDGDDDIY
jgi:hypothetical protein